MPSPPRKTTVELDCGFSLSKPQAWYIIRRKAVYHQGWLAALVSHHVPACISLRLDDIPQQIADDIQCSALMISTPSA